MAKVSNAYIESILKTLPIGYYLGSRAEIEFSENARTSHCNPMNGNIVIAAANVLSAIEKMPDSVDVEEYVRDTLYHEVSHLILSPVAMVKYNCNYVNVFEDERIETLLSKFYMKVNFKKFTFNLNNFDPTKAPKTAFELFFDIVRFRHGPKKFVNRVGELINKYKDINCNSPQYHDGTNNGWYDYYINICDFYNEVTEYFNNSNKAQPENNANGNANGNGESEELSNPENGEKSELEKILEDAQGEALDQAIPENEISDKVKDIVRKSLTRFSDPTICANVRRIVTRACKKRANMTGVYNGYYGKIDPRSVGTRKDYKWFQKTGDNCGNKFNRVHLTLWIDCSGSFYRAINNINMLVKSLNDVEASIGKDFSFDIVTMSNKNRAGNKNEILEAAGGNSFGPDIEELAKKFTRHGWSNYNVVVWDGDLASNAGYAKALYMKKFRRAFQIFNNFKSVIVSDPSNRKYLDKFCKKARLNYVYNDYAENFINVVIQLLDHML